MEQERIDQILSTSLDTVKNGLTRVERKTHQFPAAYILYFEESGKFYIGSTRDLYQRVCSHIKELRNGRHSNSEFQKDYESAENKTIRFSFIRVDDRKEGYVIEQLLLDKHLPSGRLYNVFTNAAVAGHGGKWTSEAKAKQSKVGKDNAESGKLNNAWKANSRAVSINGVVYPSIRVAAEKLGINYNTLLYRFSELGKPNSKFRGIYYYTG